MDALTFIETLQSSNVPAAVITNPFGRFPLKKFAKLGVTLSLCEEDEDDEDDDCDRDCAAEVVDCVVGIVGDDGDIDWYSTRDCDSNDEDDDC